MTKRVHKITSRLLTMQEAAQWIYDNYNGYVMLPASLSVYAKQGRLEAVRKGRIWVTTELALRTYMESRQIKRRAKTQQKRSP